MLVAESNLPFFTSDIWIIAVFVILTVAFHLILVFLWPLKKVGWKVVDYIWIVIAFLGVLSAVAESRRIQAVAAKNWADIRVIGAFDDVSREVRFFSQSTIVCRTFNRTEYSPPADVFEKTQREYNSICDWLKQIAEKFPKSAKAQKAKINLNDFIPMPNISDSVLLQSLRTLENSVAAFNEALSTQAELASQIARNDFETAFAVLMPLFLVFAFALRLTKVTGEILLEK